MIATILVFAWCYSHASAQEAPCPTLEITGPKVVTIPGESMTFAVTLKDAPANISYNWRLSRGMIEKGQGTRSISVKTSIVEGGQNVEATVLIGGIPTGCDTVASATGWVAQVLEYETVDEWGSLPNDDQRARLDNFFIELANNPKNLGLFVISTERKEGKLARDRWIKFIMNHVRFRKFDKGRLLFGLAHSDQRRIALYRLWPGDEKKICPDCKFISARDLK
jgi:hypothetical protein